MSDRDLNIPSAVGPSTHRTEMEQVARGLRSDTDAVHSQWMQSEADPRRVDLHLIDRVLAESGRTDPKRWDALLGLDPAGPPSPQALALARPAAVADYIADRWSELGLPDAITAEFLDRPPGHLPAETAEMLRFLAQNPAVRDAVDGSDGWGAPNDGTLWKFDLEDFAAGAAADLERAGAAHAEFLQKRPDASPAELAAARSVALLAANQRLVAAAGGGAEGSAVPLPAEGLPSRDDLIAVAGNPGLSRALVEAAGYALSVGLTDPPGDVAEGEAGLLALLERGGPLPVAAGGPSDDAGLVRILPPDPPLA